MRIDLEKLKNIKIQDLGGLVLNGWQKFYKLVLVIFWISIMAYGSYFWYSIFYGPVWSEAEKSSFIKAKFPENNLNKEALDKVLKRIGAKQEKFNQEVFEAKNIFKTY